MMDDTYHQTVFDQDGCESERCWKRKELIGKSNSSMVYEFELENCDDNKSRYAGKIVRELDKRSKKERNALLTEVRVMKYAQHPNIVKYVTHFQEDCEFVIMMERCKNRDLRFLLKARVRITEDECRYYISQVVGALQYLKEKMIVHRDIKPSNIFLGDNLEVKLGDFGLAHQLDHKEERLSMCCGTGNYMAPEVFECGVLGYSFPCDVWSLGVTIFKLLVGRCPFDHKDLESSKAHIMQYKYSLPEKHPKISDDAKEIIFECLRLECDGRIDIEKISDLAFLDPKSIPKCLPLSAFLIEPRNFDYNEH